jgi:hypothetical protein
MEASELLQQQEAEGAGGGAGAADGSPSRGAPMLLALPLPLLPPRLDKPAAANMKAEPHADAVAFASEALQNQRQQQKVNRLLQQKQRLHAEMRVKEHLAQEAKLRSEAIVFQLQMMDTDEQLQQIRTSHVDE